MSLSLATLAALLVAAPAPEAAPGEVRVNLAGGFSVVDLGVDFVPGAPVLTGDALVGWAFADGWDLSGRFRTNMGLTNRLGPQLAAALAPAGEPWSVGARLWPHVTLTGSAAQGEALDVAGDFSTEAAVTSSWDFDLATISLELGLSVQWVLFERLQGQDSVDTEPFFDVVIVGLGAAWANGERGTLALGFEMRIPTAPDVPFTVLGGYPRLVFGGSFAL